MVQIFVYFFVVTVMMYGSRWNERVNWFGLLLLIK